MTEPMQPEFAPFFAHLREGQICFPRCRVCGRFHWYPKPICPHCRSADLVWQAVSGAGTIYSFTTIRHPFDPAWRDALPYIVALVTFEDAPDVRLVTNIVECDPVRVRIGAKVEPLIQQSSEGEPRVVFRIQ